MEWQDDAVVLSVRGYGESDVIATLLTEHYGRHAGLVKGGRSPRQAATLQPGTRVAARWRARAADSLGTFRLEPVHQLPDTVMASPLRLAALTSAAALADASLAEREPNTPVYRALAAWLDQLSHDTDEPADPPDASRRHAPDAPAWAAGYVAWELALLAASGFALALDRCAVTGRDAATAAAAGDPLAYVSPRTGRAVSASAAAPYRAKLLPLPSFLTATEPADIADIAAALTLTGHFLARAVLAPADRGLPSPRQRWHELVTRQAGSTRAAPACVGETE